VTIRAKLAHCGTPAFSGTPGSMETSSVSDVPSRRRSGQKISEGVQEQLPNVRDVHITQIITIGSGNVTGNMIAA